MFCTKLTTFIVLCCLWQVSLGCHADDWYTWWDAHFRIDCGLRGTIYRVMSYHDNGREDRRWKWCCYDVAPSNMDCYWTGYQNDFDAPLVFQCPPNYMISGVESYHDNGREDRRWSFKCCKHSQRFTRQCHLTGWANGYDGWMDYSVGSGKVISGAYSVHDSGREDRIWKFQYCNLATSECAA